MGPMAAWRRATWHVLKDVGRLFVGGYGVIGAIAAYIGVGVGALVGDLLGHGRHVARVGGVVTVYASTRGPWLAAGVAVALLVVVFLIAVRHQHTLLGGKRPGHNEFVASDGTVVQTPGPMRVVQPAVTGPGGGSGPSGPTASVDLSNGGTPAPVIGPRGPTGSTGGGGGPPPPSVEPRGATGPVAPSPEPEQDEAGEDS